MATRQIKIKISYMVDSLFTRQLWRCEHCSMFHVFQIIALSASANKLSKLQERAEEYAALIMEELDPNNLGYIEVCKFFK